MRPAILFPLFSDITAISGIGNRYSALLSNLNIKKIVDILWHLPHSLIKRHYYNRLTDCEIGQIGTFKLKIIEHIPPKSKSRPYRIRCEDEWKDEVFLCFFKAYSESMNKNLPTGEIRYISGKLEQFNNLYQINHPDFIAPDISQIPEIEPVYGLTAGITNRLLGRLATQALQRTPDFAEWQDENFVAKQHFPTFKQAILSAHHPQSLADIAPASTNLNRLAYDELLANQLALTIARQKIKKQKGCRICGNGLLRQKIKKLLPFNLTSAQEKVLQEIFCDQADESKMLRLLQGDVGSGKTIVALMTMLNAVECGTQAAIMAPTEILAKQHFETITTLCDAIGVKVELLIGKINGKKRQAILDDLQAGKIDILIGTHALFVEDVKFQNLTCVIIDEQHRFGVNQRLGLADKGNHADVLVMTATPIPRSLVLTAYGDMEYSKIDELPSGRKPVTTVIMPVSKTDMIISALQKQISDGARAYWVCPLVEESAKTDLAAAEQRYAILQKHFGDKVGLIHGKMKENQKDEVMERFKNGQISLLVATTVIEVGVNVPEATIMIIEYAERFGLAQLHQLRGRVKRGNKPASCLLLYGYPCGATARARLEVMKQTEDGFVIAEEDLKLRGGGEILGTRQSGFNQFKLADMSVHQHLLLTANADAKLILSQDPQLASPRGQALRNLLYLFEQDDALKTYLAG